MNNHHWYVSYAESQLWQNTQTWRDMMMIIVEGNDGMNKESSKFRVKNLTKISLLCHLPLILLISLLWHLPLILLTSPLIKGILGFGVISLTMTLKVFQRWYHKNIDLCITSGWDKDTTYMFNSDAPTLWEGGTVKRVWVYKVDTWMISCPVQKQGLTPKTQQS